MTHFLRATALLALGLVMSIACAQSTPPTSGTIIDSVKGKIDAKTIEELLVDNAAVSAPAASLAGIDADNLSIVENVRDFSFLLSALDKNSKGIALALTPARTTAPFPAISLKQYRESRALRLLGSLTLGYAQGKLSQDGSDYTRRAVSVGTSDYVDPDDDPVVAVAKANECTTAAFDQVPDTPTVSQVEANRLVELALLEQRAAAGNEDAIKTIAEIRVRTDRGDASAKVDLEVIRRATLTRAAQRGDQAAAAELKRLQRLDRGDPKMTADIQKAALEAFNTCADAVLKKQAEKWNRSRYAVSYATGAIRGETNRVHETLGQTLAASVLYGFDAVPALRERAAVTLFARFAWREPVLETLGTGATEFRNSTLLAARVSGGSSTFRGLVEVSNARASRVTMTQRTFTRALGIDYRIMSGLWLNLRYGKQQRVDGTGDETGSFLTLNYSPSASLGH